MKTKILIPSSRNFNRAGAEVTRVLSIVRILTLACLLAAGPATAQVNYSWVGSTAFVSTSPDASDDIVIASTYNGYPVAHIGGFAFSGCTNLTSVTIPNSVTSMGDRVFSGCTSLRSVTLLNSLTGIGPEAFFGCTSLTNVNLGNNVTSIGPRAFAGCTSLTNVTIPNSFTSIGQQAFSGSSLTSVMVPNSVTSIGPSAFSACTNLTSVTIPNSVISIGQQAFSACTSLTNVTIPNSVTSIGHGAFSGCTSLRSVALGNSVTSVGISPFLGCTRLTNFSVDAANPAYSSLNGVLFNKAQTTLIIFPPGRGSYVIPDSVIHIGDRAFENCMNLTSATIGNSVISIGSGAFKNCTSLTSVTIPDSVTQIGTTLYSGPIGGAFQGCTSLTNVIIGNSVTNIGYIALGGCTSVTRLTIPASVTKIGSHAFYSCSSLTNFTFPGNAPQLVFDIEAGGAHFLGVAAGATVYYYCGTTGWGASYGGLPTVMLFAPRVAPGSAGVKPGGFGFTLTCLTNQSIVVEASANLVNWQPIWTNTLSGASADFVDPEWLNHSNRFYRARSD